MQDQARHHWRSGSASSEGPPSCRTCINLRTDPYELATVTSNTYWDWYIDRAWALYPLNDVVGGFLSTFKDYPPRQKAGSFTVGAALEKLQAPAAK